MSAQDHIRDGWARVDNPDWRAIVAAAFQHGAETEAEYRAERAAAAVKTTAEQRAADDAADLARDAKWWSDRWDAEVMGSDD